MEKCIQKSCVKQTKPQVCLSAVTAGVCDIMGAVEEKQVLCISSTCSPECHHAGQSCQSALLGCTAIATIFSLEKIYLRSEIWHRLLRFVLLVVHIIVVNGSQIPLVIDFTMFIIINVYLYSFYSYFECFYYHLLKCLCHFYYFYVFINYYGTFS